MKLRRVWEHLVERHDDAVLLMARALILVGLSLLGSEFARPLVASVVYNNVGSVQLNRALLAPGREAEERADQAVRAGRSFETALTWDLLSGRAYYNLAAVYGFWHDDSSMVRALSRAAVLSPGDVCARFRLGQSLAALGQELRAVQEWRAAGAAVFFVNQGRALAEAGDHVGAISQYERALAIAPDMPGGYYYLGQALSRLGRKEEALAAFEKAVVHESPASPQRYLLQAEIHIARGEWAAALEAFEWAADLSPGDPGPVYRQGWVLSEKLGDDETAIARFQESLRIEPHYAPSRLALGRLYGGRGACEEAAHWLAPLLSPNATTRVESGTASEAHILLAACLMEVGRDDEALRHLEEVQTLKPNSVHYLLYLGSGYRQTGRYHEAIDVYLHILELEPENRQARDALEELGWVEPSE